MRVLRLSVKPEWFNQIINGYKKEEYRQITDYWKSRLQNENGSFQEYDYITFFNSETHENATFRFVDTHIGYGRVEWGGYSGEHTFIITIGDIVSRIDSRGVLIKF